MVTDFEHVVSLDLRNTLDPDRAAWLRTKPLIVYWLRELKALERSIENQLAERKRRLADSPVHPMHHDNQQSRAWLAEKADYDARRARTLRVYRAVQDRKAEATALVAHYGLAPDAATWTDVLTQLSVVLDDGDIEAARGIVAFNIERLGKS